jgi:tRNA-modifying protein YgfZ
MESKRNMQTLQDLQSTAGATFTTIAGVEIPATFPSDAEVLRLVSEGVLLHDRSHWGRIHIGGADRIRFLHNQTTNNFQVLQPGQGCDTVFVNSTARTIDLVSAYILEDAVLLLTSPGYSQKLMQWMDRFIFFADKVELQDVTNTIVTFSLIGAGSDALLEKLGAGAIVGQTCNNHQIVTLGGIETRIAVGCGLAVSGHTLFVSTEQAAELWQVLRETGAAPMGEEAWQQLRIAQGRPVPAQELTEDYNPLEAGLWYTISLSKGCYIGQETIARLHTYKGVKQQLWGVRLHQPAELESTVTANGEKIGTLTSCAPTSDGFIGLAYIRTKAVQPGLSVQVGDTTGELVAVPFVTHDYP